MNPDFISKILGSEENRVKVTAKNLTNIEEYKDLIFNINIPRGELRKSDSLSKFHNFVQRSVDSGIISRQEAVSMIPPLLMKIHDKDAILDMCAAPGLVFFNFRFKNSSIFGGFLQEL